MPRPDLSKVPEYYHRYINQAKGSNIVTVLTSQSTELIRFFKSIPPSKRNYRYAKGKWTIQEVLQHVIDTERVFAYRALCFARKDKSPLPSFDENLYGDTCKASKRKWADMMEELKVVRRSTELLFQSFDREQMNSYGIASNNSFSVLAIGFIIAGHMNHHVKITKERYF